MNIAKGRSHRRGAIRRAVTLLSLVIASGVLLSGCSFPWDIGQHEADRLGRAVEDLPGVETVEATGTTNNITYPASAHTDVRMSSDATPEQLEAVLLGWRAAADPGDEPDRLSKKSIAVTYRSAHCETLAVLEVSAEQMEDTATFLPALCEAVPGGTVAISDTEDGRNVTIGPPGAAHDPIDVERLYALPGAKTGHDDWEVGGVEHRWGDFEY
jgi:hypothetical protein